MHIVHDKRPALLCGGAADAAADRDADTGRQTLKRTQNKLGAVEQVEARPIRIRQREFKQRRSIRQVSD
ncbi:hypothetical protein D3C73_1469350 [compost metagenome]